MSDRVRYNTLRLIPRIYCSSNPIINNDLKNVIRRTTKLKRESAIYRAVDETAKFDVSIKPMLTFQSRFPPWELPPSIFITSLLMYSKQNTSKLVYQMLFFQIKNYWDAKGWKFIYTDGSKETDSTAFAVVSDKGSILRTGLLFPHNSIFTTEAIAINFAIDYASSTKGKYIICTDSKSAIAALSSANSREPLIDNIRNKLSQQKAKIKVMWIPGHSGILGNENADKAAKNVSNIPTFCFETFVKSDILRIIDSIYHSTVREKWLTYQHSYKSINPERLKAIIPTGATLQQTKIFTRLRLGHTNITHQHLLKGMPAPICSACNCPLSIIHIIDYCTKYNNGRNNIFNGRKPSELLKEISLENMSNIYDFIYQIGLVYLL